MKNLLFSVVLIASAVFLSGCLNLGSDTSRDVNVIASLTYTQEKAWPQWRRHGNILCAEVALFFPAAPNKALQLTAR
jgi:hypothetical protein